MAFAINMAAAARRHLEAADSLASGRRRDVAGYLYGIAAECAVKAMMIEAGMRPLSESRSREDPFFAHFPGLRSILRDRLKGRIGTPLARFIQDDNFLNNWATRMRYSDGKDIDARWISAWASQAKDAVGSIGT